MSGQPATDHDLRRASASTSSRPVRVVAVLAGLLALGVCGAVAQASSDPDGTANEAGAKAAAAAPVSTEVGADTVPIDDLGDDPELDGLAQSCSDGDALACDLLFLRSPIGSDYEAFGDTCAGAQDAGTGQWCALAGGGGGGGGGEPVPPEGLGGDAALDALAESCYVGDMEACDTLYADAESGSAYENYGDTCAGRQPANTGSFCTALEDPIPGTGAEPTTSPGDTTTTVFDIPTSEVVVDTLPIDTEPVDTEPVDTGLPIDLGDIPAPTLEPTGLGDDPTLDELAQSCFDGDLTACDDLYRDADPGTPYRDYGDTCAGRQEPASGTWCVDAFGPTDTSLPTSEEPTMTTAPSLVTTSTLPVPPPPSHVPPVTLPPTTVTTVPPLTTVTTVPPLTTDTAVAPTTTIGLGPVPPPTLEPTGLGDDPVLDALAQSCYDGDLVACDELWRDAEPNTPYQNFADTCAGRQPPNSGVWCADAFAGTSESTTPSTEEPGTIPATTVPPTTVPGGTVPVGVPAATQEPTGLGDDATLDGLAQSCFDGDMQACDDLFDIAPFGSAYRAYGDTCAGRQEPGTFNLCRVVFAPDPRS